MNVSYYQEGKWSGGGNIPCGWQWKGGDAKNGPELKPSFPHPFDEN